MTTVRVKPVSVCVTVTVTPGSTAPLSSVTRPFSAAVACAQAIVVVRSSVSATAENPLRNRLMAAASVTSQRLAFDIPYSLSLALGWLTVSA